MLLRVLAPALVLALAALLAACAPSGSEKGPLVFAAASLQESLEEIADLWAAKGNARPVLSFAGTPALARQIDAGAAGDIFISADTIWMNEVARKGLVEARTRSTLATNALVLIAPAGSMETITIRYDMPLETRLVEGKLALADPDAVPAGRYAKEALIHYNAWPHRQRQLIRTENVRVALALVARGEAALGIVYASDARSEPGVRVLDVFPQQSHRPIEYPMARLAASTHPDSDAFLNFLRSPEAQAILARHGFGKAAR